MSLWNRCYKVIKFCFGNLIMNTRYGFMNHPCVTNPQFLHNFIHTPFLRPQIPFYSNQQQYFPYPRQYHPYMQSSECNHQGMSGADGRHEEQPNRGVFWDKFRDIKKRARDLNIQGREVENKKMRSAGVDQDLSVDRLDLQSSAGHRMSDQDPADKYQSRPKWKKTSYGRRSGRHGEGHLFSICSYNILAQNLLEMHPDLYEHCIPDYLQWEYRKRNLLNELKKAQADIMCLQEVQADHFLQVFQPEFKKLGFTGVFKKRTGDKRDGCAIFYRNQCFQQEAARGVEYYHRDVPIMDRDNIGLIVVLKSKQVPSKLCIANTHLLFNPKRGDVKLAQLSKLFAEIDKVAYEMTETGSGHCPIILCGDFNSEPMSPLYNFIVNASLDYTDMLSGDVCRPLGNFSPHKRGFKLRVPLLPSRLRISESCRYVDIIEQRGLHKLHTDSKDKCENDSKSNIECKAERQLKPPGSTSEHPVQMGAHLSCSRAMKMAGANDTTARTSREDGASDTSSKAVGDAGTSNSFPKAPGEAGASSTSSSTVGEAQGACETRQKLSGHLHHNLNIESTYLLHDGLTTTHHTKTNCVVDFMFNSRPREDAKISDIKKVAFLPLFTDVEADEMGGLPNKHWSSDHYRLQVKFMLRPPVAKQKNK